MEAENHSKNAVIQNIKGHDMTTIAYKDNKIAFDSRLASGDYIIDDDFEKYKIENDCIYVFTGNEIDLNILIDCIANKKIGAKPDYNINASAFFHDKNDVLFMAAFDPDQGFWMVQRDKTKHYAFGCGMYHAITAMDCGLSAAEAIQKAAERDMHTGGIIRIIDLKTKQIEKVAIQGVKP